MGAGEGPPPEPGGPGDPVKVVRAGTAVALEGPYEVELEGGGTVSGRDLLPPDLPLGYHELHRSGGGAAPTRLVIAPGRCHLPAGLRTWGWAVQLYALRSAASWGMGDLADLADLARWSAGLGAGMALVNPLHACRMEPSPEPSPYFPSSRCWRNPLYLRVEDVPGVAGFPGLEAAAAAGRALDGDRRIDRGAIWELKRQALEWAWDRSGEEGIFAQWRRRAGPSLAGYARFATLGESHAGPWHTWPEGIRHPGGTGVEAALAGQERRVGFHEWLQWLLDGQLARAAEPLDLVADMAVGVDPDGADAWLWQGCFALGVRAGAPPDEFNAGGQDWGLPPFDPWRLRAARYEPFVQTLRGSLAHAGGLRVDHVMGLFRLWWVPPGEGPERGVYVRYPWREMLDILALESVRARAFVVGEDLGTVEPWVRRELRERAVLSYRLMWFEPEAPGRPWPVEALAAVTTHDLPTVAGLWTGADLQEQAVLGLPADPGPMERVRRRVAGWMGVPEDAPAAEAVVGAHRLLARAPSMLLAATLEDAALSADRPNFPGTGPGRRPNWSLALPRSLEELKGSGVALEVARALGSRAPVRG